MNNIRKTLAGFLVFGMLATFAFAQKPTTVVSAQSDEASSITRNTVNDDFSDETEVDSQEIGVSISQSTTTSTSQSLTVSFRSKTLSGFRTAIFNYIIGIDDANYTGDPADPAPEGYDVYDEETGLPLFEGYVAYVTGSVSENNKNVYIPSKMTFTGRFTIKVTRIDAGAVSTAGCGSTDIPNTWTYTSGSEVISRIKNIYIPSTITEIKAGAFTGMPTDGSAVIHYEGSAIPSGFETGWVDADVTDPNLIDVSTSSYDKPKQKNSNVGGTVDIPDPLGRPLNFILGYVDLDADKNYPLTVQYDLVTNLNGVETRETIYEALPLVNTRNPYDACGPLATNSYTRTLGYKLGKGQSIDDSSVVFHNIRKTYVDGEGKTQVDFTKRYFARPIIGYSEKQNIDNLVHVRASTNSTFAGYSMFTLKMDRNLSIKSAKYPQPHSLYLDVKTDVYEQNKANIKSGKTKIRYLLYNLYNSSYHFVYVGANNELKDVVVPVKTVISYQNLENDNDNLVSILLKNSAIAPDFNPSKVRLFELMNITIQMDLITTTDSGSVSILGKSSISYKFAYITIINSAEDISVFNWNLFLIIFFASFVVVYAAAAFATYKIMKEKFKNDEFRRVNGKKFLKKAILGGLGLGEVLLAVLFIILRTVGFKNTIVVYNPTDPLLIATAIVGLIIFGYFIVYIIKLVKAEKERRKAIRLKLNEDVEDDGTN